MTSAITAVGARLLLGAPGPPVQAAQLIDQNHAGDISDTLHCHLERIALTRLVMGQTKASPVRWLNGAGVRTSAGRLPACVASGLW